MEDSTKTMDEVDGGTVSLSPKTSTESTDGNHVTSRKDHDDDVTAKVIKPHNSDSVSEESHGKVNGIMDLEDNEPLSVNKTPTTNGPSKEPKVISGTESEDDSEGLVIDLKDSENCSHLDANAENKAEGKDADDKTIHGDEKVGNTDRKNVSNDPGEKQESGSSSRTDDQPVDYFEKLENSLRAFEKTLEDSRAKRKVADDIEMEGNAVASKNDTSEGCDDEKVGKEVEKSCAEPKTKGPENDMKEMEILLKEFQQTSNYSKVGDSSVESSDKATNENTDGIDTEKKESSELQKVSDANTTEKSEKSENQAVLPETSEVVPKPVTVEKVKNGTPGNPSDAWSQIGMKRCPNCSFTTDQDAMLQSHTVLCSNRFAKRGDIVLKFKANRYGCETCLFTTKLRRSFEEHIAFHLLAQPYICLTCVETFDTKALIEVHVKKKHAGEQVRCGLRGSKKVNHIIETLHKTSVFNFTGRVLDKKVWMAASDMRLPKEKTSGSEFTTTTSETKSMNYEKNSNEESSTVTVSTTLVSIAPMPSLNSSAVLSTSLAKTNEISTTTTRVILNQPSNPLTAVNNAPVFKPTSQTSVVQSKAIVNSSVGNTIVPNKAIVSSTVGNTTMPLSTSQGVPVLLFPVTMPTPSPAPSLPINIPHFPPTSTQMVSILGPPPIAPSTQLVSVKQPPNVVVLNPPRLQQPSRILFVQESNTTTANPPKTTLTPIRPQQIGGQSGTVINRSLLPSPAASVTREKVTSTVPSAVTRTLPVVSMPPKLNFVHKKQYSSAPSHTIVSVSSLKNPSVSSSKETSVDTTQSSAGKVKEADSAEKDSSDKLYFVKSGQKYTCRHCNYMSGSEHIFKMHIWKHFHITQTICKLCKKNAMEGNLQECALVDKVMTGLMQSVRQQPFKGGEEAGTGLTEKSDTNGKDVVVLSDEEDEPVVAKTQGKDDCNETHIVIQDGNIKLVEVSPRKLSSIIGSNEHQNNIPSLSQKPVDNDGECEAEVSSSTDNEKVDNNKDDEDSGMTLKIMSTYSLSTDNSGKSDKSDISPKKLDGENNKTQTSNSSRSPILKDSGNIFDKIRDSMDMVIEDEYGKRQDDRTETTSRENEDNITEKEQQNIDPASAQISPHIPPQIASETDNEKGNSEQENASGQPLETKSQQQDAATGRTGSFYVCGFTNCGFRCMASGEFREHLSHFHGDATEFSCAHCGHKSYTDECHFRHMLGHSKFSSFVLYSCGYAGCLYGTNVKDMFLDHWQKFHPKAKSYKCISCREVFPTVEELVVHLQANILKFVQCPHCTVKDRNRRVILNHITQSHPGKPRQITVTSQLVCQEREENAYVAPAVMQNDLALGLPSAVEVKKEPVESAIPAQIGYMGSNEEDDNYSPFSPVHDDGEEDHSNQADTSGFEKKSGKGLSAEHHMREIEKVLNSDKHRLRHLNSSVIRCPHCSYLASGRGLLKKHIFCHKRGPVRDRPFACPYCPSTMDKLSKLSLHLNLHEGNHKLKVFFCGFCSLKTNVREKMINHGRKVHKTDFTLFTDVTTKVMRIKVNAYFCDQCENGFRDKTAFDQHVWTHSEEARANTVVTHRDHYVDSPIPRVKSPSAVQKSTPPSYNSHSDMHSPTQDYPDSPSEGSKRFRCKECGKYMSRLPVLKQHMMCHMLDEDTELVVFKCSYCAYTSTSKLWVSEHSQLKHPGKLVRVKRRIDIISAANNPYSSSMVIHNTSDRESSDGNISIDNFHCDLCSYSCADADVLHRHKNSQHPESLQRKPTPPHSSTRKPFVVPLGNVYKNPVWCSECPYNTKIRLDLLRHIKIHPQLIPESQTSPHKEKPKQLLKVAIGKRRVNPSFDPYTVSSPPPEKVAHVSSPSEPVEKKPVLLQGGAIEGFTPRPTVLPSTLYFLGGDLLHLKLRPCFTQVGNSSEFMCQLCEETFSGRYLLHKHILQHMEVSFYRCAYCEHGTLESSAMVVHIQKVHRKPIQHNKIEVTNLESKINKFIHNIKEREYSGQVQMDYAEDSEDKDNHPASDIEDNNFDEEEEDVDVETDVSLNASSSERTSEEFGQTQFARPKFASPNNKPPISSFLSSPWNSKNKKPVITSPADDHPSIKKMGDIYKCRICGYTVTSRSTIIQHITIHSTFKKFGCPFCSYRSHWKHDTIKHIRTHHPDKDGEPTKHEAPHKLDTEVTSPPMPKLSPQTNIKPKFFSPTSSSESVSVKEEVTSPLASPNENHKERSSSVEYTGGFRHTFKCLLCDAKFRSRWKIFRHFATTCSQPMLGCSKCRFKDLEPSVIKSHIEEKHVGSNEEARIVSLNRDAKYRKYTIPLSNTKAEDRVEQTDNIGKVDNFTISEGKVKGTEKMMMKPQPAAWNLSTLVKRIGNHYKCKECGFTGGNKFTIIRHAKRHKMGLNYQCSYCEYKSDLRCNVKRHMNNRHPARPNIVKYLNNVNPTFINNLDDVDVDEISHSSKSKFIASSENQPVQKQEPEDKMKQYETKFYWKCLECGHKAACLASIYRHFKKAGCLKTMYGCSVCKFKSFDRAEVQSHVANENPNKGAELQVCPSSAKIKKFHIPVKMTPNKSQGPVEKEGSPKKDIFCPVCHLKASNEQVFQTHIDTEHFGMTMVCGQCSCYRTKVVSELQKHMAEKHPNQAPKFSLRQVRDEPRPGYLKCPKCDYTARRGDVKSHLFCHVDYKPFCCPYCPYRTRKAHAVTNRHIPRFHPGKPEKVIRKGNAAKEKEIEDLMKTISSKPSVPVPVETRTMPSPAAQVEPEVEEEQNEELSIPEGAAISTKTEYLGRGQISALMPSNLYKVIFNSKAKKNMFKCLKCPYISPLKNTIVSHVYHHMPYIFKCPYCSYQTYPRSMVTKHIKSKHPKKQVYVIDERYRNPEYQHLASAESSSPAKQDEAQKPPKKKMRTMQLDSDIFSDEGSSDEEESPRRKVPVKQETGRLLYCCHLCPYTSESYYHYRQHLATHGGFRWQVPGTELESRLKCGYCSYLAMDDQEFNRHLEVHLTTRPFSCPYCDFSQYTQCKVKYHISQCHANKPVEVLTQSSSAGWVQESKKFSTVMLVQMDPKVKLVDILSVGPEECERILTDANVSVVDFDCLNDERFTALANTLGISVADGIFDADESVDEQIKKEYSEDSETFVSKSYVDDNDEETMDVGSVSEPSTIELKTESDEKEREMEFEEEESVEVAELSKMEFLVKDECGGDDDDDNIDNALEDELLKESDEDDCDKISKNKDSRDQSSSQETSVKRESEDNSTADSENGDGTCEKSSSKVSQESSKDPDEIIDEVMEEIDKEPNTQESEGFVESESKDDDSIEASSTTTSVQDSQISNASTSKTATFESSESQSSKTTVLDDSFRSFESQMSVDSQNGLDGDSPESQHFITVDTWTDSQEPDSPKS